LRTGSLEEMSMGRAMESIITSEEMLKTALTVR
jgi:hypothetical protein